MINDKLGPDIGSVTPLTDQQLQGLIAYADSHVMYPGNFPHMGIHGRSNVSVFNQHTMSKQPIADRKALRQVMPSEFLDQAILEYFIEYPSNKGFLDLQTYWMNKRPAMRIVAYCLSERGVVRTCRNIENPAFSMQGTIPVGDVAMDADKVEYITLDNAEYWANRQDIIRQNAPTEHVIKQGQGFILSLNNAHEIPVQPYPQRWFCLGIMMSPDDVYTPKSWID